MRVFPRLRVLENQLIYIDFIKSAFVGIALLRKLLDRKLPLLGRLPLFIFLLGHVHNSAAAFSDQFDFGVAFGEAGGAVPKYFELICRERYFVLLQFYDAIMIRQRLRILLVKIRILIHTQNALLVLILILASRRLF